MGKRIKRIGYIYIYFVYIFNGILATGNSVICDNMYGIGACDA